jgi:hypothetical protein
MKPNKKICIEVIKKNPIISGAIPTSKDSQLNNFLKKNTEATIKDIKLVTNPINVIILSGSFECFIMPKTPMS